MTKKLKAIDSLSSLLVKKRTEVAIDKGVIAVTEEAEIDAAFAAFQKSDKKTPWSAFKVKFEKSTQTNGSSNSSPSSAVSGEDKVAAAKEEELAMV